MLASAQSFTLDGLVARPVRVEVDVHRGLPAFSVVGLPDAAVREARERVRAALTNCGFEFPLRRIVANLAPASLRKAGPGLDLAIAVALLTASGQLAWERLPRLALVGELALDGSIRAVSGALAIAEAARDVGAEALVVPAENGPEAALVGGIEAIPLESLSQLTGLANGEWAPEPPQPMPLPLTPRDGGPDLADLRGQRHLRRALEVSAAGGHSLLMVGPPGAGKSLAATRLPTIMPPLAAEEALEVARIASACGRLGSLGGGRPFRAPHHSVSPAGLVGGGNPPRPGEATLAQLSVLECPLKRRIAGNRLLIMGMGRRIGKVRSRRHTHLAGTALVCSAALALGLVLPVNSLGAFKNGRETLNLGAVPYEVLPYPGSRLLLFCSRFGLKNQELVRLGADGSLDPTFGRHGVLKIPVGPATVAPGGKILLVSEAEGDILVRRLLPNGRVDRTFGHPPGRALIAFGHPRNAGSAIAMAPKGNFLIAGLTGTHFAERYEGDGVGAVGRQRPNAGFDLSFGPDHSGYTTVTHDEESPRALAALPGGGVLVQLRSELIRLRPNGALDRSFGDEGRISTKTHFGGPEEESQTIPKVRVLPDGKFLLAGVATQQLYPHAVTTAFAVRYLPNGEIDMSYGEDGYAQLVVPGSFFVQAFAAKRDGSVLVAGNLYQSRGPSEEAPGFGAARFTPSGHLDRRFGENGIREVRFPPYVANLSGVALQRFDRAVLVGFLYPTPVEPTLTALARISLAAHRKR